MPKQKTHKGAAKRFAFISIRIIPFLLFNTIIIAWHCNSKYLLRMVYHS